MTDAEVLQNILCIHQPHFISPVMEKYARHPKICGILGQITAAHLPFWDGSVKCMQSMLFVKPPQFQGQAWHQDEIYIPTRDRSLIGAWIAMDDATIENGCLWVVPGSHRTGYLYPQHAAQQSRRVRFCGGELWVRREPGSAGRGEGGRASLLQRLSAAPLPQKPQQHLSARSGQPLHERLVAAALERCRKGNRSPAPTGAA